MKPTDFQKLSVLDLCGEISESDKKILDEHLAKCRGCSNEFREMKQTLNFLNKLPAEEPSPAIRGVIMNAAAARKLRKKSMLEKAVDFLFNHQRAFKFVAVAGILLITFFMLQTFFKPAGNQQVGVKTTPNPAVTQTLPENGELSAVDIDQDIYAVKMEIQAAMSPPTGLNNALDFYGESYIPSSTCYEPFANSRPYRNLMSLNTRTEQLIQKAKTF